MKKEIKEQIDEFDREDKRLIRIHLARFRMLYKHRTGKEPDKKLLEKEKTKIIKKYIIGNNEGLHQAEKEEKQLSCILDILHDEKKHLSIEEMSQCLINSGFTVGSSVKTIYRRILPMLIERGAMKDDEKKFYIPEYKRDPEIEQKYEEEMTERMETVAIISNFLDTLKDTPFYEKAKEYIDSEFRFCRHRNLKNKTIDFKEDTYSSRVIFMGAPAANINSTVWDNIHSAMINNFYIKINYLAEKRTKPENYTVRPYQLIFDNGFWELWGECTNAKHRGTKLFNLSRILGIKILEKYEKFTLPEFYDFRSTLAGCFGCYNDNEAEVYNLKIAKDSYAYIYIKDRIWGEFQEIKETEDGYILEFEATQYKPILRWVLSWGSEVIPLAPQKLVDDWKKNILSLKNYL